MPTCSIRILGGLPVTVTYTVQGPEPDVGIMSSWIDDFEITHIAGRKVKKYSDAAWIYARLDKSKAASDAVIDAIYDSWCHADEYD